MKILPYACLILCTSFRQGYLTKKGPYFPNVDIYNERLHFAPFGIIVMLSIFNYFYNCCLHFKTSDKKKSETKKELHELPVFFYVKVPFNVRLRCLFLKMIILSYLPISAFLFNTINCYQVNNTRVVYVQGDIGCYNYWQKLTFVIMAVWVAPLCGTLHMASRLLEGNKVSTNQFTTMLVFPLCVIIYYVYTRIFEMKSISSERKMMARHLLSILYQSFRRRSDNKFLMWQCVLNFHKLILVTPYTYINHPVGKLYTLLFILNAFQNASL